MWKPGCRPFQYSLVKLHRPIIDADQMHKEGGGANRLLCPWRRQRRWMTDTPRRRAIYDAMPCYQYVSMDGCTISLQDHDWSWTLRDIYFLDIFNSPNNTSLNAIEYYFKAIVISYLSYISNRGNISPPIVPGWVYLLLISRPLP